MLGAIIGDVAGSDLEVQEIKTKKEGNKRSYKDRIKIMDKNTPLFNDKCETTDDSCLTVAIADAILNNIPYEEALKKYGKKELEYGLDKYGRNRFGQGFTNWLNGNSKNDSYGNGCAMRISPVGFLFNDIEEVKEQSRLATISSHNNLESIKCAEMIAVSICLLKNGLSKEYVRNYVKINYPYFNLDFNLEYLRHNYTFTARAIDSVPQALFCFFESNDFEDAIRKALSIGGDADTIACITGSLAEAHYGIPEELKEQVKPYLKDYMVPIIEQFYKKEKQKIKRK